MAVTPDFEVVRGTSVIASGNTALSLVEGTDYDMPSSYASDGWFLRITSTHYSGMGRTSGGGSQNADDVTCYISAVSSSGFTFTRVGSANNCRIDWEIICYVGSSGGDNEIKVREQSSLACTSTSDATSAITSISSDSDVVPFITGQSTAYTARNNYQRGLWTATLASNIITFQRGDSGSNGTVSYAAVEFTGSNWTVHAESYDASGNHTMGFTVADLTKAFIHTTYRYDTTGTCGLDDASTMTWLSSTTVLSVSATTSTGLTDKEFVTYIVENSDTGDGKMVVTREDSHVMAGSGEEEIEDVTISSVTVANTSVMGESNKSTGTGTAFPRGYVNLRITAATTLRLVQSDNGQTSTMTWEIVEWPGTAGSSPNIKLGTSSIVKAYLGSTVLPAIYLGAIKLLETSAVSSLTINNGETTTLDPGTDYHYNNITINSGGKLVLDEGTAWVTIRCDGALVNNGTIECLKGTGAGTFAKTAWDSESLSYTIAQSNGGDGGAGHNADDGGNDSTGNGGGGSAGNSGGGGNASASLSGAGGNGYGTSGGSAVSIYGNTGNDGEDAVVSDAGDDAEGAGGSGASRAYHGQGLYISIAGNASGSGTVTVAGGDGADGGDGGDANHTTSGATKEHGGGGGGGAAGGSGGKFVYKIGGTDSQSWTITTTGGSAGSGGAAGQSVNGSNHGTAGSNGTAGSAGSSSDVS